MGRASRKRGQVAEQRRKDMPRRRSWRRRQRRLGRSANPSAEALNEQIWYHGSGQGPLRLEDIDPRGGMSWLVEGGFNLVSLSPVARMYGQQKAASYKDNKKWHLHKIHVNVQNPLDRTERVQDNPRLWEAVKKYYLEAIGDNPIPLEVRYDLTENDPPFYQEDVIIWFNNTWRAVYPLCQERIQNGEFEELGIGDLIQKEGWDCIVGPMRKWWRDSHPSEENMPGFGYAEELLLLDPQNQIKELR